MNGMNKVGHFFDGAGSDKVYIVSIVDRGNGTYNLVAHHGKKGGPLKTAEKEIGVSWFTADKEAARLIRQKFNKKTDPYVDIETSEYQGSLTRATGWLKQYLSDDSDGSNVEPSARSGSKFGQKDNVQEERAKRNASRTDSNNEPEDDIVICVNNAGYESFFDIGVEYLINSVDGDFMDVIDKYGEEQTCYRDRFRYEHESEPAMG